MHSLNVGAAPRSAARRTSVALIAPAIMLFALLIAPAIAAADDVTATAVALPATPPVHGQTATLRVTVSDTTTPAVVPMGSVQFYLDGTPIGAAVALSGGSAQVLTSTLSAGSHAVRAAYLASPGFLASEQTKTWTVLGTTTTVLRITPDRTGVAGQDLLVETEVRPTPALGPPTGVVSFSVGGQHAGDDTLDADGISRTGASLPAVSITILATYQGDRQYAASSGSATVTVNQAGTVIALSASPNPAFVNEEVTFVMLVDSLGPSMWWPSGELSAAIGGQPAFSATLYSSGDPSSFKQTFPSAGIHHVSAHFAGDANFLASEAALDETVNALPIAPASPKAPSPLTAVPARGMTLKAAPKRDRRAPYRFTVSGSLLLPSGVTEALGCTGKVNIAAKLKTKRVASKAATLTRACRFRRTVSVPRKGSVKVTAAFAGNARVSAASAHAVKVRAG